MIELPVAPQGVSTRHELPLPWQPSRRSHIAQDIFMNATGRKKTDSDALHEYLKTIEHQYIITSLDVRAVDKAIGWTGIRADAFYTLSRTETPQDEVQRRFEQEFLGLPPADTSDGLYFFESAAGFASGAYPIEPMAALVGASPEKLDHLLHDIRATRFGHVLLRFSNYIVPVAAHRLSKLEHEKGLVVAGDAVELSAVGEALVDVALALAETARD